jgi:hypothetical protein
MKNRFTAVAALALALVGCKTNSVVVATQTGLGISISENPATQLYEGRLGYFRNEVAYIPGNTNNPASIPDVLMEIRMENLLRGGMIYQRLAVGKTAVTQPGASLMFAKDRDGQLNSNVVDAVTRKIQAVPEL